MSRRSDSARGIVWSGALSWSGLVRSGRVGVGYWGGRNGGRCWLLVVGVRWRSEEVFSVRVRGGLCLCLLCLGRM